MEFIIISVLIGRGVTAFLFSRSSSMRKKKIAAEKVPAKEMMVWASRENIQIPNGETALDYLKTEPCSLRQAGIIGAVGFLPFLYYLFEIDSNGVFRWGSQRKSAL